MEYYYSNRSRQIPAFGSWDCYGDGDGDLPYTQCFETVHQTGAAGFIHYTYPNDGDGDLYAAGDLYVAGDLYANDVVTRPAVIAVPRRRKAKVELHEKLENNNKDGKGKGWEVGDFNYKEPQSPIIRQKNPKPVDEDLYKISPHLLYAKTNKKRKGLSFFSCWILPSCGL